MRIEPGNKFLAAMPKPIAQATVKTDLLVRTTSFPVIPKATDLPPFDHTGSLGGGRTAAKAAAIFAELGF